MSNYFDIHEVQPYVMEYKEAYNNGDTEKAKEIFNYIYPDIDNVIHGVIYTHKYWVYDSVDDLKSIAIEALLGKSGLAKFDPDYIGFKGKKENLLFSYISLIAKRSIYFHCIRKKKSLEISMSEYDIPSPEEEMPSSIIEDSDKYIRPKFINTRFYNCYDYLIKYLKINGRFDKRDFFRMVRGMLNAEEDVIPKVTTRLDQDNTLTRANAIIRKTIKLYQLYLSEYLKETDNGFIKLKKSTKQNR